jgi:hypothetical protein
VILPCSVSKRQKTSGKPPWKSRSRCADCIHLFSHMNTTINRVGSDICLSPAAINEYIGIRSLKADDLFWFAPSSSPWYPIEKTLDNTIPGVEEPAFAD